MAPPAKRNKVDKPDRVERLFSSVAEISQGLRSQDEQALLGVLTGLRNQFTIKHNESTFPPDDGRIRLAREWMETSPGAKELFDLWTTINQPQMGLSAMVISLMSCLLNLLSVHYPDQHYGLAILRTLFLPQWYQKLNTYLHGSHSESILVTMKLYTAMSNFAGGRERKTVVEIFAWDNKVSKLLNMRRRGKGEIKDILSRPDIRTLYVLFILSFIDATTPTSLKTVFLEQRKESLAAVFKGLGQDPYSVVRLILEKLWGGLWSDTKLKKTLKISLFNETVLSHLHRLYDRDVADEGDAQENIPADLIHHFLLAISTHPGTGICFRDNGWYTREENPEVGGDGKRQGRIYNKILASFLKTLKINEDLRQQELAIKIMAACPELVAGYWAAAALTLEPRLSSKWLANIAFLGAVISLPSPTASFLLPGTAIYHPSPPSITTIIENILPTNNFKTHLTKGLQSPSPLVRHSTALTLAKCLRKYDSVVTAFQEVADVLEEEEGQWRQAIMALEVEARKRVPELQAIIAFSQQKSDVVQEKSASGVGTTVATLKPLTVSMISESALRILWLYHKCLPTLVAEGRFDSGKLLWSFLENWSGEVQGQSMDGWDMLRRLHVLRLLKESDQFSWSGKAASHSNLWILLQGYLETRTAALRREIGLLLRHVLAGDPLFQHDPDEIYLWLECIPSTSPRGGTKSPDGVKLLDGGVIVVKFLDECFLRCARTPYKYLEDLSAMTSSPSPSHKDFTEDSIAKRPELFPSPVLMTVLEQLSALVRKDPSPSDLYSLSAFVRHLIFGLAQKTQSLLFIQAITEKVNKIFGDVLPNYPNITRAVQREIRILCACLAGLENPPRGTLGTITDQMQAFLAKIEGTPLNSPEEVRMAAAMELVDWARLADHSLHPSEALRLASAMEKLHPAFVRSLVESFHPDQDFFWQLLLNPTVASEVTFDWALVQTSNAKLGEAECRNKLISMVQRSELTLATVKRVLTLVCHRVEASRQIGYVGIEGLLQFLGGVMTLAKQNLPSQGFDAAKEFMVSRLNHLKVLCMAPVPSGIRNVLGNTFTSIFDSDISDRSLLGDIVKHWLTILVEETRIGQETLSASSLWIRFAYPEDLLAILDKLLKGEFNVEAAAGALAEFVDSVFSVFGSSVYVPKILSALNERLTPLSKFCLSETGSSAVVQSVFAQLLKRSLPLGYDGYLTENGAPLSQVLVEAQDCWVRRLKPLAPGIRIETFLSTKTWTTTRVDIFTSMFYHSHSVRRAFGSWLERGMGDGLGEDLLVPLLHGFLDSCPPEYVAENRTWDGYFSQLLDLVWKRHASPPKAVHSAALIFQFSEDRTHFTSILSKRLAESSVESISHGVLTLASKLWSLFQGDSEAYVGAVVDRATQWVIRRLSDGSKISESDTASFRELGYLIRQTKTVKIHLAEHVIASGIKYHLQIQEVISLCTTLAQHCNLKPASSNKHLQSIVQHQKFFAICTPSALSITRDAVIRILRELFFIHPQNACQPSHIEPLRAIYGGTLSTSDRTLISIFHLFEVHRKLSCASILSAWSSSGDTGSNDALGAVLSLDAGKVFQTCLNFPRGLKFDLDHEYHDQSEFREELYDPLFLNLIFARVVSGNSPSSASSWVQFFRTNIVCVIIRSLSSKDDAFRELALSNLSGLWKLLEAADMQEKPHVIYLLNLLRAHIPAPTNGSGPPRLPTYASLMLCHATRGIFYPSNFIYPLTARFLLQRAELDTQDVPMFLGMLYSGSDENWRRERAWMIRFLTDGMASAQDWKILRKRHVWDLVASMFQGFSQDHALRNGILEFLIKITSNRYAVNSLLLRSGLLSWVEIQVHGTVTEHEALQLCRVLDNVLTVSDATKMESVTEGQWRKTAMRIAERILEMNVSPSVLSDSVSLISRLQVISPGDPDLLRVIDLALESISVLENGLRIQDGSHVELENLGPDLCPKHSAGASLVLWGNVIVTLWRVVMGFSTKPPSWDALTLRLLIWRCIAGERGGVEGEWARREAVRNLRSTDDV